MKEGTRSKRAVPLGLTILLAFTFTAYLSGMAFAWTELKGDQIFHNYTEKGAVYGGTAHYAATTFIRSLDPHIETAGDVPIIVQATLGLGGVILVESALSFLGFGVPPPAPSWGRALSGEGLDFMLKNPGLAIFPGLAIATAVFGFNMLGDALRDLLDPRLQGTAGGRA